MTPDTPGRLAVYVVLVLAGLLGAASDAALNQWAKTGRDALPKWCIVLPFYTSSKNSFYARHVPGSTHRSSAASAGVAASGEAPASFV